MHATSIIVFAALSCLTAAQSLSQIPVCAQKCFGNNLGGCGALDFKCICSNTSLINGLSCCVFATCSAADQDTTIKFAQNLCLGVGVTVATSASCSSTSAPASASSTAGASSASNAASATTTTAVSGSTTSQVTALSGTVAAATGSTGAAPVHTGAAGMGMGLAMAGLLVAL